MGALDRYVCLGGALVRYVSLGECTGWIHKYTYAREYEEVREWDRPETGTEHLPQSLSPYSFETGSLNEHDAQLSARLVGQRAPGIFLPLLHPASRSSVPSLHIAVQEEGA